MPPPHPSPHNHQGKYQYQGVSLVVVPPPVAGPFVVPIVGRAGIGGPGTVGVGPAVGVRRGAVGVGATGGVRLGMVGAAPTVGDGRGTVGVAAPRVAVTVATPPGVALAARVAVAPVFVARVAAARVAGIVGTAVPGVLIGAVGDGVALSPLLQAASRSRSASGRERDSARSGRACVFIGCDLFP